MIPHCDKFVFVCVGERGPTLKYFAARLQRGGVKLGRIFFFKTFFSSFFSAKPSNNVESCHTAARGVLSDSSPTPDDCLLRLNTAQRECLHWQEAERDLG